jgi:hypothetical protein
VSEDEPLADVAIAGGRLNDGDQFGAAPSERRFGNGAGSVHPALAVDAKLVAMTNTPSIVIPTR